MCAVDSAPRGRGDADRATRNVRGLRAENIRYGVDGGQSGATEAARAGEAVGERTQGRNVLDALQEREKVQEATLWTAADQPRAQGGLPLSPQRHERAVIKQQDGISPEVKVRALRSERSALAWMMYRPKPPINQIPWNITTDFKTTFDFENV